MSEMFRKIIVLLLLATVSLVSSYTPVVQAAAISTETILNQQTQSTHNGLRTILAREDVRKELVSMGVDPEFADRRIAALTDYELSQIQQHIGELPAGSSALAVLGAVFLVLLVLELVGVTNIFNKL